MNATRVLWDDVPAEVKADLAGRTDVKQGGVAIVDRLLAEGGHERWADGNCSENYTAASGSSLPCARPAGHEGRCSHRMERSD